MITIPFKDPRLLDQALTHRSFLNEDSKTTVSNERLEFLGDSVLSLIVSTELFARFPNYPEGKLTSLRSALVRTKTLAKLAKALNYGDALKMSRGEEKTGGRENESLLADTFEAVLGAIYLDQGLEAARKFLQTHLFPLIDGQTIFDYKSKLQEVTQQQKKVSPIYRVLSETGPDHDKVFVVGVYLSSKLLAQGSGKSKQEAQQEAAHLALEGQKG
ncbi:MAG: ribonuclease III [Patescibacteria group bacterium]|nr:ribonuclease III [Patescibacteria group bacterium]MCL5432075.1 ribonuclease III [Patescibacteria group bacterium]